MKQKKSKGKQKPRRPWMKWVKWMTRKKNRAATNDTLHHEKFDDIPTNKQVKAEDPWGWD